MRCVALAAVVLVIIQLASSEPTNRKNYHTFDTNKINNHRAKPDVLPESSGSRIPLVMDKVQDAEEFKDEVVDIKVEKMEDGKMALEFKSHGRAHKFYLQESRHKVDGIDIKLVGSNNEEQEKAKLALKGIKLMEDTKFGAVVAVKEDADGETESIVKSGVFSLGKHEFQITPETGKTAKVHKRSIDEVKELSDGVKANIEPNRFEKSESVNITKLDAVVELLLIADFCLWEKFCDTDPTNPYLGLVLYFAQMVSIMDSHYNDMQNDDLRIRIRLVTIIILVKSTVLPDLVENHIVTVNDHNLIDGGEALTRLRDWLGSDSSYWIGGYDHVMLVSCRDLFIDGSLGLLGIAWLSTICIPAESSSVVEIRNTITANAFVATHELGHSLGAYHDGTDGSSEECENENYIMSASAGQSFMLQNKYRFSCCSQRSFYAIIRQTQCLFHETVPITYPPVVRDSTLYYLPGQIYDADDQCYMHYGTGACYVEDPNVCLNLYCQDPLGTDQCYSFYVGAADGTPCDVNKWCIRGECVSTNVSYIYNDHRCDVRDCYGSEGRCRDGGLNRYTQGRFQCYPNNWRCDFYLDCTTGSDEENCPQPCPNGWTSCLTGVSLFPSNTFRPECIPNSWICDNVTQCEDGSDEMNCPRNDMTTTSEPPTPIVCGGYLSGDSGSITAPAGDGGQYANLASCYWTIQAPAGKVIELTFTEQATIEDDCQSCSYDFMMLVNGYGEGEIAKLCGIIEAGTTFVSNNDVMYVTFISDGEVNFSQWTVDWRARCPDQDPTTTENCGSAQLNCSDVTMSDCSNCIQVEETCCNACKPPMTTTTERICEDEPGFRRCRKIRRNCADDLVVCENDCERFSERCCATCCRLFERFC